MLFFDNQCDNQLISIMQWSLVHDNYIDPFSRKLTIELFGLFLNKSSVKVSYRIDVFPCGFERENLFFNPVK